MNNLDGYVNWLSQFSLNFRSPVIDEQMDFTLKLLIVLFVVIIVFIPVCNSLVGEERLNNEPQLSNNIFDIYFIIMCFALIIMGISIFKSFNMLGSEFETVVDSYSVDFDYKISLELKPGKYDSEYIVNGINLGYKWNDTVEYQYDTGVNKFESVIMSNEYGLQKEFITIYYE